MPCRIFISEPENIFYFKGGFLVFRKKNFLVFGLILAFLVSATGLASAADWSGAVKQLSLTDYLANCAKKLTSTVKQPAPTTNNNTTKPTTPTAPTTNTNPSNFSLTADEKLMLDLVNKERVANGLAPLKVNPTLTQVARAHSADMIKRSFFNHNNPDGKTPFDRIKAAGITYRTAGENIAGASTTQTAHTNLMNSPGHRANILNASFTEVGIGIVDGGKYGKMFTQNFIGK